MVLQRIAILVCIITLNFNSTSAQPLWTKDRPTPLNGLSNPYELPPSQLHEYVRQGRLHGLNYPVDVTGILIPYHPMKRALAAEGPSKLKKWLQKQMQKFTDWQSFDDFTSWLGLHEYPASEGQGPYFIPFKDARTIEDRMGVTRLKTEQGTGFTFSCAACHSSNLFGQPVLGMTNRFPRANELFVLGIQGFKTLGPRMFKFSTGATDEEKTMYKRSRKNMQFVEAKKPVALGLDTSLAHVALSLSHRKQDEYASMEKEWEVIRRGRKRIRRPKPPRYEPLRHTVGDSKPAPWWNVKYKNKWLSDGSLVSGNPIYTNILWNEIGRGTDLHQLEHWLNENDQIIKQLTTAVFNAQAPVITDFFPEEFFDLNMAIRGQQIYEQADCAKCHGSYKKAWQLPHAGQLSLSEQLKTIEVDYPEQTPVKDVGTDPHRHQMMSSLIQLNDLAISKKHNIVLMVQDGYVPPPLVGIWARWPYLHNNSIPNLCALFTPPAQRPVTYYSGEALDPDRDFDFECNGYPLGEATPEHWKTEEHLFDTRKKGLANTGHYKKQFLDEQGNEKYGREDKLALIHYLQTL